MESGETLSVNYTAIIKELDHITVSKTIMDKISADYQSESISDIGPNKNKPTLSTKMELSYNKNLTYEITLFTMLNMDHITNPQNSAIRLEFI